MTFSPDHPDEHGPSARSAEALQSHDRVSAKQRVYNVILARREKGASDEAIWFACKDMQESTARARRVDLVNAGLVVDSGLTQETMRGNMATVWIAKAFAGNQGRLL